MLNINLKPLKIAVLGSGFGSSFRALLNESEGQDKNFTVELVISNKSDSGILEFAKDNSFKTCFITSKGLSQENFADKLDLTLQEHEINLLVLTGFMRILSSSFTSKWHNKIINIHPSLLPKHKGLMDLDVHQAVINNNEIISGCSVHYVIDKVDEGDIIYQSICQVEQVDTPQTLRAKVQALEGLSLYKAINIIKDLKMTQKNIKPKTALISVSDKTNLIPFAKRLHELGVELISTGGTLKILEQENIPVQHVSNVTDFPEIMGGRIKTLHPLLLGGILGRRDTDQAQARYYNINWIDLVVCNLYPFESVIEKDNVKFDEAIENIDIGGPTMLRAAAKNFIDVASIVSPNDYDDIIKAIEDDNLNLELRKKLAKKTFYHTTNYDSLIANYFDEEIFTDNKSFNLKKDNMLRYGENPHQQACVYKNGDDVLSVLNAEQLQGKQLSYNNLVDAQAAVDAIASFKAPCCAVIKHAIPCGMAMSDSMGSAFSKAFLADEKSAFGGVIALSQTCDINIANQLENKFVEIVIAPDFSDDALKVLSKKINLRLLKIDLTKSPAKFIHKHLPGGMLIQESDMQMPSKDDLEVVTGESLSSEQFDELLFAFKVVKQVKSNAIVITKNNTTVGIGGGQVSRVDAVEIAINKAGINSSDAILASDAFIPFRDSIDLIAKAGIKMIIQPGGSKRDKEVIEAAWQHGICMVFTSQRAFNH